MLAMFAITLDGRRQTVWLDFGEPLMDTQGLAVRFGKVFLPVKSCRDYFGDERRDDLTAKSLAEIAEQLVEPAA